LRLRNATDALVEGFRRTVPGLDLFRRLFPAPNNPLRGDAPSKGEALIGGSISGQVVHEERVRRDRLPGEIHQVVVVGVEDDLRHSGQFFQDV
jgi:hypothetical protein